MATQDRLSNYEVALLFGVDPKTVTRWGTEGLLSWQQEPDRQRSYPRSEVEALHARLQQRGQRGEEVPSCIAR